MFCEMKKLKNGVEIPVLALGTWFIDDDKAADAVKSAVQIGYRHVDTVQAYGNERGVGEGIRTCGIPREELFVTSKVAAEHKTYEAAAASIDKTLEDMGLDYLDMMIMDWCWRDSFAGRARRVSCCDWCEFCCYKGCSGLCHCSRKSGKGNQNAG